jgi:hypothetical protein
MMGDLAKGGLAIVLGIILVAIVSVIVAPRSTAPAGIAATGDALARVIHAAVNPVGTAATNGQPLLSTFSTPAVPTLNH